jgi:hypothetical protein
MEDMVDYADHADNAHPQIAKRSESCYATLSNKRKLSN